MKKLCVLLAICCIGSTALAANSFRVQNNNLSAEQVSSIIPDSDVFTLYPETMDLDILDRGIVMDCIRLGIIQNEPGDLFSRCNASY